MKDGKQVTCRRLFICMIAGLCVCYMNCSQKQQSKTGKLFLVGGDTISISMVNRLVPDSLSWSQKLRRAALELACVKVSAGTNAQRPDSEQVHRIGSDLALQLSRQSPETWSPEAGRALFDAAKVIAAQARQMNSLSRARAFADSLLPALITDGDSALVNEIQKKTSSSFDAASTWQGDPASLERLIAFLFDLPLELSRIVCEFVVTADVSPKTTRDMSAIVKGLVYDSAGQRLKKKQPKTEAGATIVPDNSKEALRYRSKGSIKDSIEKHIPDLEALYKKHLKTHQNMEGTVWVTFSISSAGNVLNARIKTSSITEKDFLIPFRDYVVQKIRFQSIPEKAGTMSVEFPFEFTPTN
jgi:hypothetical protein